MPSAAQTRGTAFEHRKQLKFNYLNLEETKLNSWVAQYPRSYLIHLQ